MFIVEDYAVAVLLCFVAMISWGSWANTQKLAEKSWRFELFYWDYSIGILLFSLLLAFTLGSWGTSGRSFILDIQQAKAQYVSSAMLGGLLFNISNILLVAAIAITGMSVAITVCVGIALSLGVFVNYLSFPVGHPFLLSIGVACIIAATLASAYAYKKNNANNQKVSGKGILLAVISGLIMSFFYRFIAGSMTQDFMLPESTKLTPYTAIFFFSAGLFLSNLLLNSVIMKWPFTGSPVNFSIYFKEKLSTHLIGVLGGIIWCLGLSSSIIASGVTGFAISYGLGQGATVVAVLWGIFVWKEFRNASLSVWRLLWVMIFCYIAGLASIIISRFF